VNQGSFSALTYNLQALTSAGTALRYPVHPNDDIIWKTVRGGSMNINEILPVLGPGVFMQVLIQAYFIKHCWENRAISQHKKTLYIIAIAVFNIPAAAAYLFLTRKKETEQQDDTGDYEIDSHIRQGIFVLLVVAYEVFSLRLIFMGTAIGHSPAISWMLSACFLKRTK
jgi:hypothetical protein